MLSSKEINKIFMENLHLGIAIFQNDKIVFVNKKFAKIVETTPEEIMSLQKEEWSERIHPEDRSKVLKQIDLKMRDIDVGKITRYEMKVITKNKKIIGIEIYSDSIIYEGKPAIFLTIKKTKKSMNNTIKEEDKKHLTKNLEKLTNDNLEVLSFFFNRIRNQIADGKNIHSIEIYVSNIIDKIQSIKEKRLFNG